MEDAIFTAIRWFLIVLGILLTAGSLWALWCNPGLWIIGALCGAVVIAIGWTALGLTVISMTAESKPENAAPAWPLFFRVLAILTTAGALAGGLGGSFLWGRFPWEKGPREPKNRAERTRATAQSKTS